MGILDDLAAAGRRVIRAAGTVGGFASDGAEIISDTVVDSVDPVLRIARAGGTGGLPAAAAQTAAETAIAVRETMQEGAEHIMLRDPGRGGNMDNLGFDGSLTQELGRRNATERQYERLLRDTEIRRHFNTLVEVGREREALPVNVRNDPNAAPVQRLNESAQAAVTNLTRRVEGLGHDRNAAESMAAIMKAHAHLTGWGLAVAARDGVQIPIGGLPFMPPGPVGAVNIPGRFLGGR